MSAQKPGAKKTARRGLRTYRNAIRGAARWAVAPWADPVKVSALFDLADFRSSLTASRRA